MIVGLRSLFVYLIFDGALVLLVVAGMEEKGSALEFHDFYLLPLY